MTKVTAPNRGYNGISAGVVFTDGVGETDNAGALAYFRRAGYELDEKVKKGDPRYPTAPVTEAPETWERPVPESVPFGSPLRDAAVAPLPKDFLPPTNAGQADPHGPLVVSPGLHAVPPAPIVPGPVAVDDPKAQEALETRVAEAVLVEHVPANEVPAIVAEHRGETEPDAAHERPAKSHPKPEWVAFAIAQGMDPAEADAASKKDLIERFGDVESDADDGDDDAAPEGTDDATSSAPEAEAAGGEA